MVASGVKRALAHLVSWLDDFIVNEAHTNRVVRSTRSRGENEEDGSQLRFIADPGHGWLEVPASEVRRLDLQESISRYSYITPDGALVYLEEDCDFDRYAEAKIARGEEWKDFRTETVARGDAFVRALPSYDAARLA